MMYLLNGIVYYHHVKYIHVKKHRKEIHTHKNDNNCCSGVVALLYMIHSVVSTFHWFCHIYNF